MADITMANKIIFDVDLIDVLENKYNMNQLANVPTKIQEWCYND